MNDQTRRLMDDLMVGSPKQITTTMYKLLYPLSNIRPADQLRSAAVLFLMLCSRFNVDVRRVLEVGDQIIKDAERTNDERLLALRRYMENEL